MPLAWRLGPIDPGFGLDSADARAAIRAAVELWDESVDDRLFVHDAAEGFPISFDFDDRQALLAFRLSVQRTIEDADYELELRRSELEVLRERLGAVQAEYEERAAEHRGRTREFDAEVRRWNERGQLPRQVREDLRRTESLLAAEGRSLVRTAGELRALQELLQSGVRDFNDAVRERNDRARALDVEDSLPATEAGRYRESIRTRDGTVVSVDREIRIFRFADRDELVAVIAHELGHALGLGHGSEPGSVMSPVAESPRAGERQPGRLPPDDLRRLRALCPELRRPGSDLDPPAPEGSGGAGPPPRSLQK